MHSVEGDALEFPKQLNCSSKNFFERKKKNPSEEKKASNPITLHFTVLSAEKVVDSTWSVTLKHSIAMSGTVSEQSLSGSAQSNLGGFLHLLAMAAAPNSARFRNIIRALLYCRRMQME